MRELNLQSLSDPMLSSLTKLQILWDLFSVFFLKQYLWLKEIGTFNMQGNYGAWRNRVNIMLLTFLCCRYLVGNLFKRKERSLFQWLSTRTTCATRNVSIMLPWIVLKIFLSLLLCLRNICSCTKLTFRTCETVKKLQITGYAHFASLSLVQQIGARVKPS